MYVSKTRGGPEGTPRRARSERFCLRCGWHPAKQPCEHAPEFNKTLRIALLNNNLREQARRAG